jgi:hypothetical protein
VYLEALLENLTALPMRLDSVSLEPSAYFDVKNMNTILNPDGSETDQLVFGPVNRFNSGEFRQYLFCLTPKESIREDVKLLRTITVIGKLDIMWTSGVGSKGHLQTSQLERMGPAYSDVKLSITKIPSIVRMKEKFYFTCRISNCSDQDRELYLYFDNSQANQSILWLGISGKSLGVIASGQSVDIVMTGYPIKQGLAPVPKIRITDGNSQQEYNYEEIAYVFVNDVKDEDENMTGHGLIEACNKMSI